ncbi:MAG: helicase C-terminal domain-containing protein [Candidatus Hodarchaeales archaeon]
MNSAISDLIIHPKVRPQQERTFVAIQQNWGRYHSFFCSLPTGSGKTDLAACLLSDYLLLNSEGKIDILVPYKMHQDFWYSVLREYGRKHGFSVALLKGRGSYYCPIVKSGANISPCAFDPPYARTCKSRQRCQLLKARREIRKAKVRILNWWVFKYVDLGDEKATFRVFDEAHNLLNLESLVRLEITSSQLKSITNDEKLVNTFQEWEQNTLKDKKYVEIALEVGIAFLNQLKVVLSEREAFIAKQLNNSPNSMNLDTLRDLRRVTELILAISELIDNPKAADLAIFFQREYKKKTTKLTVQPFDISYIFTRLFRGSKSLFMSATIGDGEYLAKMLGLNPNHCLYIRESSAFNKDNHPFILINEAIKLSTANPEKKKRTFNFLKRHIQPFLATLYKSKQRGLILASSFELARLIEGTARANGLVVVTHTEGKSDKAIKSFINSKEGDVLITPSAWEGISLDDDLARLCLIPKVPFPMMFDPIIQRKTKKYPQFLENDVLITIQQAHGRIQRNKDDWGVTVCFDENFRWLKNKRRRVLEPWFSDRIETISLKETLIKFQDLLQNNSFSYNFRNQKQSARSKRKITSKDYEWLQNSGLADLIQKNNKK